MRTLRRPILLLALAVLTACSSARATTPPPGGPEPSSTTSRGLAAPGASEPTATEPPEPKAKSTSDRPAAEGPSEANASAVDDPSVAPPASESFDPDPDAYEVTATVTPSCVKRGQTARIVVTTVPNAGVAYHAVYANEEGGAPPPYGKGHGGNDGGQTNIDGHWEDTWTIGPSAPSGPGRVDVVVGKTDGFGQTSAPFAVANVLTGRCD